MNAITISSGLLVVFFRPACRSVHTLAAPLDTQETTDRRVPIPKNVPLLRIDHISIESALLGVRGKLLRAAGWPDCEENELAAFGSRTLA
jgi:hypothetical protein